MTGIDLDKIWQSIIASHPLIRTEELEARLTVYAQQHWAFGLENPDSDQAPESKVSVCVMIALLREIIAYREAFGPLEPASQYVFSHVKEGENHEQAAPERRTGDGEGDSRPQPRERDRENSCRQPCPTPAEGRRPRSRH